MYGVVRPAGAQYCAAVATNLSLDERILLARRVRAAMAYHGIDAEEVIRRLDGLFGIATLRRITSPTNPRGASPVEIGKLADACEVPLSWLLHGEWDDAGGRAGLLVFGAGSVDERLQMIEAYLSSMVLAAQSSAPRKTTP